jgi:hypothetical protein
MSVWRHLQTSNHHLQDHLQDDQQYLHRKHSGKFQEKNDGHFQDIKKLMEKGVHLDSQARYFTGIWPRGAAVPSQGMQRDLIKCNILWQGNPILVVKPFGKSICALCYRELIFPEPPSPINSSILALESMEHANTNQGSIGIMHRRNPQC